MDIPQHKHCVVCGKAIPLGEEFCSDTCRDRYQAEMKKRRFLMNLFYAMILFFIFMMVISAFT